MKTLLTAVLALTFSVNTLALGKNEEQALQVIGGLFLIDQLHKSSHRNTSQHDNYQRYYDNRYGDSEIRAAYEQGRADRERKERERARRRAYECGYSGNC